MQLLHTNQQINKQKQINKNKQNNLNHKGIQWIKEDRILPQWTELQETEKDHLHHHGNNSRAINFNSFELKMVNRCSMEILLHYGALLVSGHSWRGGISETVRVYSSLPLQPSVIAVTGQPRSVWTIEQCPGNPGTSGRLSSVRATQECLDD